MKISSLSSFLPGGIAEPDFVDRIRRGKRYRSLGAFGAVSSVVLFVATKLIAEAGGTVSAVLLTLLIASLMLIAWTRLWFRESKEPFQYTYSVGEFERVPTHPSEPAVSRQPDPDPIRWLTHDLKEKLSERVPRLSLLEQGAVPESTPDSIPASHVHISGWFGFREADGGEFEVIPEVRLGGKGAPAKLARSVRLRLDESTAKSGRGGEGPTLTDEGYQMLFERVYWSVASQIYAQIHRGVAEKVKLLPRGSLRASAYVHEADDYATSNTLDAYAAAQELYREALEIYDIRSRKAPATPWRVKMSQRLIWLNEQRRRFRRWRAGIWRRAGRREVMQARAELGLARMLVAEWHLGRLCGMMRKEIYEAGGIVSRAIDRLEDVPPDVPEQEATLFRAHVARATIRLFSFDHPGAHEALEDAERQLPAGAREDADFLFAAGMIEPDRLRSLRLLGQAVERDPTMERALYHRAQQCDEIWRRRDTFESELAATVDEEYSAVIALNPGNLSAWGRRGFVGWLLAEESAGAKHTWWRARAISALETGRQYKEVRRDATVAELDWNLARLAAESGDFPVAYEHYIEAVSARLADPRIDFDADFYLSPTETLIKRFRRYEERVMEEADTALKKEKVTARLIRSVKAFVFNDCGLAYQAHYHRSGREQDLNRAWQAFNNAREENDAFVLPTYNLAKLDKQISELPGSSTEEKRDWLGQATELLEDVLRREPDWAPAQLLMVEIQTEIATIIGGELKLAEAERPAAGDPGAEPAGGKTEPARPGPARIDHLAESISISHAAIEEQLHRLLPHDQFFSAKGNHRVDLRGTHVESLIDEEPDRWTKDFSALHVAAMIQWGRALAATAPTAGEHLCAKLRTTYYRAQVDLLAAHRDAAFALFDGARDRAARAAFDECENLFRALVREALKEDPVHLLALKATSLLPAPERRRALEGALVAGPSETALIWIGDAQVELEDHDGAIATFERAARAGKSSIAPVASLRLARQFERSDLSREKAIEAYREAARSSDPPLAAEGAAAAGRLLRLAGKKTEAADEYTRVASESAEMAMHLAARLESEDRKDDALGVFRAALTAGVGDDAEAAEVRLRLGLALMSAEDAVPPEARAELQAVAATDLVPIRWEAAMFLARGLAKATPAEARPLYEQMLAEDDPAPRAIAAMELGALMEAGEEADAANSLRLEQAQTDPQVAARLAELMREKGGIDVDAFLAEVNAKAAA